jgi:hypothetical protein
MRVNGLLDYVSELRFTLVFLVFGLVDALVLGFPN